MFELKRVDVWSVVKVAFVLSFFLGLFFGFVYLMVMFVISRFAGVLGAGIETEVLRFGGFVGFFVVIFIAIFTSVFYTIVSAILAALYNLISGWTGGVRVKLLAEEADKGTISNE